MRISKIKAVLTPSANAKSSLKALGFLMLISVFNLSHAAPWDNALQEILNALTGTTATILSGIAVAIVGFLAMMGRLDWGRAGMVIAGIAIVFGAVNIANWVQTNAV